MTRIEKARERENGRKWLRMRETRDRELEGKIDKQREGESDRYRQRATEQRERVGTGKLKDKESE